jgi:hypothetical protein
LGHEDVDITGLVGKALWLAGPREVGDDDARLAELLGETLQRFLVARREYELRARLVQPSSDVRPKAGRSAGEQHGSAAKILHDRRILVS